MNDDEYADLISAVEEPLGNRRISPFATWTWGELLAFITGVGGILFSWRAFTVLFGQNGVLPGQ